MIYIRNDSNLPDEDVARLLSCLTVVPTTFEQTQFNEFTFVVANYKEGDPMPDFPSVVVKIDDQTYSVSLKTRAVL